MYTLLPFDDRMLFCTPNFVAWWGSHPVYDGQLRLHDDFGGPWVGIQYLLRPSSVPRPISQKESGYPRGWQGFVPKSWGPVLQFTYRGLAEALVSNYICHWHLTCCWSVARVAKQLAQQPGPAFPEPPSVLYPIQRWHLLRSLSKWARIIYPNEE